MLDAGFLHAEDSDRHVSLAIGAVAVLAGPMPDFDSLASSLAERILSMPRFTHVLRTQPVDLGAPRWVNDTNVDISHHVRRAALPRPGDDAAFSTEGRRLTGNSLADLPRLRPVSVP